MMYFFMSYSLIRLRWSRSLHAPHPRTTQGTLSVTLKFPTFPTEAKPGQRRHSLGQARPDGHGFWCLWTVWNCRPRVAPCPKTNDVKRKSEDK